ncbi:MAG: peptide ABC transporter substrate-binding protein [Planctomycetota bacterium]
MSSLQEAQEVSKMTKMVGFFSILCIFFFLMSWGLDFEQRPPADLVMGNEAEPATIDPATMTGVPEGRICELLYEGLFEYEPTRYAPALALAQSYQDSEDGLNPTFILRKATWNNRDPICAQDFQYSWMRVALADNASDYAFMINQYIEGADFFGQLVQTDLGDLLKTASEQVSQKHKEFQCTLKEKETGNFIPIQLFDLRSHEEKRKESLGVENTTLFRLNKDALVEALVLLLDGAADTKMFPIELSTSSVSTERLMDRQLPPLCRFKDGREFRAWKRPGTANRYQKLYESGEVYAQKPSGWPVRVLTIPRTLTLTAQQKERIYALLEPFAIQFIWKQDEVQLEIPVADHFDYFSKVGVEVLEDNTLKLKLTKKVPFLLDLLAFHTLRPVHRETIECYPLTWMKPENLVSNGPFDLVEWKIQNRMYFVKNEHYWDKEKVKLNTIEVLPLEDSNTAFSLYETGLVHIILDVPTTIIPYLQKNRPDFLCEPYLGSYFYRCNVTRSPMKNKNLRKALNYALDKEDIVANVSKAGEKVARTFTPPGFPGYNAPEGPEFNPTLAKEYLEKARKELGEEALQKKIELLYNTNANHKSIAERIQSLWKEHLGIQVELANKEWKVYLDDQTNLNYDISRAAWIGDYNDPNTFLDIFITNGDQNRTGWSNTRYDELILKKAALEADPKQRMKYFREAEEILIDELPILPIYFYVTKDMVNAKVKGLNPNIRNLIAFKYLYRTP